MERSGYEPPLRMSIGGTRERGGGGGGVKTLSSVYGMREDQEWGELIYFKIKN